MLVTIKKLRASLRKNTPKVSATTLLKNLKRLGFHFKRQGNRLTLMERTDIVAWRHRYILFVILLKPMIA